MYCILRKIEKMVGVEIGGSWRWDRKRSILFVLLGNKKINSEYLLNDQKVELEGKSVGRNVNVLRELMVVIADATALTINHSPGVAF